MDDKYHILQRLVCIVLTLFVLSGARGVSAQLESKGAEVEIIPSPVIIQEGVRMPAWKTMWDEARLLARAERFDEALGLYEQVLAAKPDVEEVQWEMSWVLIKLGKRQQAEQILEKLVELEPLNVSYLRQLGMLKYEEGHFSRAVSLLTQSVREVHEAPDVIINTIINCYLKQDKGKEALPFVEELYNRRRDVSSETQLAKLLFDLGFYERAKNHLVHLAETGTGKIDILLMAAKVHNALGLDNLAISYWRQILEIDPRNAEGHRRLADFYERQGSLSEALYHFVWLWENDAATDEVLKRIGSIYVRLGDMHKALYHYNLYAQKHPGDKETIRALINIHAVLGDQSQTLAYLEKYFAVEQKPDASSLAHAARLYDASGRYHEAIPLYKKILESNPDNPEILAPLAEDLLAIGENEGALSIWKHLASQKSPNPEVYRSMAGLYDKLDRQKELIEVLETLVRIDPRDVNAKFRLAQAYLEGGWKEKAAQAALQLKNETVLDHKMLYARAKLYKNLGMTQDALMDVETYLRDIDDTGELNNVVYLLGVELAGRLGRLDDVYQYHAHLETGEDQFGRDEILVIAKAFANAGDHEAARRYYSRLFSFAVPQSLNQKSFTEESVEFTAMLGMAELYQEEGLRYEYEETLRKGLLLLPESLELLQRLFYNALASNKVEEAGLWLGAMTSIYNGRQPTQFYEVGDQEVQQLSLALARISYLRASGEVRKARSQIHSAVELFYESFRSGEKKKLNCEKRLLGGLRLAYYLLAEENFGQSARLVQSILNDFPRCPEAIAFGLVIQQNIPKGPSGLMEETLNESLSSLTVDQLLQAAGFLRQMQCWPQLYVVASLALEKEKRSTAAAMLVAISRAAAHRQQDAVVLLKEVYRKFPENVWLISLLASMQYQTGEYDEAALHCNFILGRYPDRVDIRLLSARILWAQDQWPKAIKVYRQIMSEPVGVVYAARLKEDTGKEPKFSDEPASWLFSLNRNSLQLQIVGLYSPERLISKQSSDQRERVAVATELYSLFCWQEKVNQELVARNSIYRREYYSAVKQYKMLLRDEPQDSSLLFDLGGIYSKLDRLGEEAGIYEQILENNVSYPGLSQAIKRNNLKRQPRFSVGYASRSEEGWNESKAINRRSFDATMWLSPVIQHEVEVAVSRINYQSTENDDAKLWGNRAYLNYKTSYFLGVSLELGVGAETIDNRRADSTLFRGRLRGEIGDKLETFVSYEKDVVNDTIQSISQSLDHEDVKVGVAADIFSRLQTGADYSFATFSDGNVTEGYSLWGSYLVFSEPTKLLLGYEYDFLDSREGSAPALLLSRGTERTDHPYWVPQNYWLNSFSLKFRHDLEDENLGRGIPRYYTLEYLLGHNSEGDGVQNIRGAFLVEVTPHFLFVAEGEISNAKSYKSRALNISVTYRW